MPDILMIDDDDEFVGMIMPLLSSRGFSVRVARTGTHAMAMCQEHQPHGVILGALLPDTNGIAWLQKWRPTRVTTPVWFVSAFRFAQEAKAHALLTKTLGAKVLSKPMNPLTLVEQIVSQLAIIDLPVVADVEMLDDLEAEFAKRLPEKLSQLCSAVRAFVSTPNAQSYESALMQAHRLHGSAGMYGLAELGERAGHLERVLREAGPAARKGGVNQELIAKTEAMLSALAA